MYARELPWPEVKKLAEANAIALLPVGSTEAHGPHLPLCVDVIIAEEVARRVAKRLRARGERALIFPAISYSLTDFANGFAGTVSVSGPTNEAYLTEVLAGIAKHGFHRIGVLNHHVEPDHFRVVHAAAKAASQRTGAGIVVPDHRKKPISPRLGEEFTSGGSHAGLYETSLVMAAARQLVNEGARLGAPDLNVNLPAVIKAGAKTFEEAGGPDAYFGSPRSASVEEGERLYEILAEISEAAVLALP